MSYNLDYFGNLPPIIDEKTSRYRGLKAYRELEEFASAMGVRNDPRVRQALTAILRFPSNSDIVAMQSYKIHRIATHGQNEECRVYGDFLVAPKRLRSGHIYVGEQIFSNEQSPSKPHIPIFISLSNISEIEAIIGTTGSGKSIIEMRQALILERYGFPTLTIDPKKDQRGRIYYNPDTLIFPWRKLELNPWFPLGDPLSHLQDLADGAQQSFKAIHPITKRSFIKYGMKMYKKFGIIDNPYPAKYPNFFDFSDVLRYELNNPSVDNSEKKKIETLLAFSEDICVRLPNLKCNIGYLPSFFREKSVIVEVGEGLSSEPQRFLVNRILSSIYRTGLASKVRDVLSYVMIIDEAHTVLNTSSEQNITFFTENRGLGTGVIVGSNFPANLPDYLVANINTYLFLRQSRTQDINWVLNMTCSEPKHRKYIRGLTPGQLFLYAGQPYPIMVQAPNLKKGVRITDEMLEEMMNYPALKEKYAGKVASNHRGFPQDIIKFLECISHHNSLNFSEICSELEISKRRGMQIKGIAEANDLVTVKIVHTGANPAHQFELTEKGRRVLEENL